MTNEDSEALVRFLPLARSYTSTVENQRLEGLPLLRELRQALADLYAFGPRLPDHAPFNASVRHFDGVTDDTWQAVFNDLLRRLPRPIYWSGLLPLTYENVGDRGASQLSEDLSDLYRTFDDGFRLQSAGGTGQELLQWWGSWETSWGNTAVRAIGVLHEVITDLDMKIYG